MKEGVYSDHEGQERSVQDPDKRRTLKTGLIVFVTAVSAGSVVYSVYQWFARHETPKPQYNPDNPSITGDTTPTPTITLEPTPTIRPEYTSTQEIYERPPFGVIPESNAEITYYAEKAVELAYERLNYEVGDPGYEMAKRIGLEWMSYAVDGVAQGGFSDKDVIAICAPICEYECEGCGEASGSEERSKSLAQDLRNYSPTTAKNTLEWRCNKIFNAYPGSSCAYGARK